MSQLLSLLESYSSIYEERDPSHPHWQTNAQFKKSKKRNDEMVERDEERKEDRLRNQGERFKGKGGKIGKTQREEYEYMIDYLISEGYADNEVSAEVMCEHMSEEWLKTITEKYVDWAKGPKGSEGLRIGNRAIAASQGRNPSINRGEITPMNKVSQKLEDPNVTGKRRTKLNNVFRNNNRTYTAGIRSSK